MVSANVLAWTDQKYFDSSTVAIWCVPYFFGVYNILIDSLPGCHGQAQSDSLTELNEKHRRKNRAGVKVSCGLRSP